MMLRDEHLLAWWKLARVAGIGNVALNSIRNLLPTPMALAEQTAQNLIDLGVASQAAHTWQNDSSLAEGFESLAYWRNQKRCGVLLAGVDPYPELLATLPDAPIILYYYGNLEALKQPKIAMVGSRNATPYALDWAQKTAQELAAEHITVVSGLALGIDGAAHQGAVKGGRTIAVLGSGLDVIYPQRHLGLAQMISEQGLLLSEFPLGTAPLPQNFPSRNRIVSGLSLGTIVVEAAIKSGSLITAKLAADQGREVFALPGAVTNPLSHGCHQLIRDGAVLVQNSQEVLQELNLAAGQQLDLLTTSDNSEVPKLLHHVDFSATAVDVIASRARSTMVELLPELLDLELQGWLQQVPGGYLRVR